MQRLDFSVELVDDLKLVQAAPINVIYLLSFMHAASHLEQLQVIDTLWHNVKIFIMAHAEHPDGRFIVLQDTGGYFGLQQSNAQTLFIGAIAGLIKTLQCELPTIDCHLIDTIYDVGLLEKVVDILEIFLHKSPYIEISLPKPHDFFGLTTQQVPIDKKLLSVSADTLNLIVSGGAKGITVDCLLELAKIQPFNALILGRTQLVAVPDMVKELTDEKAIQQAVLNDIKKNQLKMTPKEINRLVKKYQSINIIEKNLANFRVAGCQVIYEAVDVNDEKALQVIVNKQLAYFKQFNGFVHAAGIILDKKIIDKPDEQFWQVFDTKVRGAINLLSILKEQPLKHIVFFSSVAGRYGNVGQADYATANESLNKIADYEQMQRGNSTIVKSINWGPWESGMVNEALKKSFAERGIGLIPMEGGGIAFVNEFFNHDGIVEVVIGNEINETTPEKRCYKIDSKIYPFLESHKIRGNIVLPMCFIMELMINAVQPTSSWQLNNFHVLKGVTLLSATNLYIEQVKQDQCVQLVVTDEQQHRLYHASLMQGVGAPYYIEPYVSGQEWPITVEQIYQPGYLFHGVDFQGIKQLITVDAHGGSAFFNIKALTDGGLLPIGLLDCGLQLLILWHKCFKERLSLPMGFAQLQLLAVTPNIQTCYCHFIVKENSEMRSVHDVLFKSEDNAILAVWQDVEMYSVDTL